MQGRFLPVWRFSLLAILVASAGRTASEDANLERRFDQTVRPFVDTYCISCHGGKSPAAQFSLAPYTNMSAVVHDYAHWNNVLDKLNAGQMPPKGMKQPSPELRQQIVDWITAMRRNEAQKSAGDPGVVLARRLSNSEYNYTIRDLTGVDIRPTREFPVDPANTAGFDNSGESLTMSPAMLAKYLLAAREVANHMALTPDGIVFAPHSMIVETDREKFAIRRIVDFYLRQPTDYADYFETAWRYKHRAALGKPAMTLTQASADGKVSPGYLPKIREILGETPAGKAIDEVGPIAKLRTMWRNLPAPKAGEATSVRAQCEAMRDFAVRIRKHTAMQFAAPVVKGLPPGSQPLLNWKLREYAAHRRESDPNDLRNDTDPPPVVPEIPRYPGLHQEAAPRWAALSAKARAGDTDLIVPAAERKRYEAAFSRFASVFPDTFYVLERGRYFPDDSQDKGRLLSAGYHSVVGFFRDDTPLVELILDEKGRKELDRLWTEFDYIAHFTTRTWTQYFFNQSGEVQGKGAESGTDRPPDAEVSSEKVVLGLRDAYVAKAKADPSNDPIAVHAIEDHFKRMNDTLRGLERIRVEAEPRHVDAVVKFAGRAWRRPLSESERTSLRAFYRSLRDKEGLTHEEAIRDSIVSILMSPNFSYHLDRVSEVRTPAAKAVTVAAKSVTSGSKVAPLPSYALANRLSYFLWSSMPDEELMAHAGRGDLQRKDVLLAQVRRMLKDPKARAVAVEFTGNWLDFRRFEEHNAVDRDRFPTFTNELREAMFEEPVRLIDDAIRNDRSVLDLIYGKHTFVNPVLAKHYGMPQVSGNNDNWVRVEDATAYGRGGLLPMSVFLTRNSPGLRTSPVKRGYWVVRRVLGETIPPPPPNVPELPQDEAQANLPLREMLAKHRSNAACAGCHARFDSYGLAFEGYGPIGERREKDLAGRPVDTRVDFPKGQQASGFEGVRTYIREHRQNDFVDTLCRMLLAYSLGRSLTLSDDLTVERMAAAASAHQFRFSSLVETIVTSPQFLNRRVEPPAVQQAHTD